MAPATFVTSQEATEAERYEWHEAEIRKQIIEQQGQPVRLRIEWWGCLLVVVVEPLDGFVHLVRNWEQCVEAFGEYHVSVAQYPTASNADYNALHAAWNGVALQLPIAHVSNEGCMELGQCTLFNDVFRVHNRPDAWYADRSLHISG